MKKKILSDSIRAVYSNAPSDSVKANALIELVGIMDELV